MNDLASFSGEPATNSVASRSSGEAALVQLVTISEEQAGQRIDNFLLRICKGVPKRHLYRVLRSVEERDNIGRIDQTYRLASGDVVRLPPIRMPEMVQQHVPAAEFKILLEDKHLLVID